MTAYHNDKYVLEAVVDAGLMDMHEFSETLRRTLYESGLVAGNAVTTAMLPLDIAEREFHMGRDRAISPYRYRVFLPQGTDHRSVRAALEDLLMRGNLPYLPEFRLLSRLTLVGWPKGPAH